jgi:hypothetical protein
MQAHENEAEKMNRHIREWAPKNAAPGLVVRGAVPEEASPKVMVAPVTHSHDDT